METNARKAAWRRAALAARRARSATRDSNRKRHRDQMSAVLAQVVGIAQGAGASNFVWGSAAVYDPFPSEPDIVEFTALLERQDSNILAPNPEFPGEENSSPFVAKIRELSAATNEAIGLIIVPALALGADGSRLGRGGGWYDRAIEWVTDRQAHRPLLVGVCFHGETHESGRIPTEAHDVRVDVVATDQGFLFVDGGNPQVFTP